MTIKGNEMIIYRGESFTIDRLIRNRDGSPFIVSSKYNNPYLLLTVSSTKYSQQNRYILNYWISLEDLPRFPNTVVKEISSINDANEYADDDPMEFVYHDKQTGKYKYLKSYKVGETAMFEDYSFRVIHHFRNNVTKDWVEQSYMYSIRLVAGPFSGNSERPIELFDVVQDILLPTKLTVMGDLNGGLQWLK